ncbi:uncharacterized protein LY79DRAFT_560639 [Colletotrichum navitas]|uniref:Uncharacterized protein n=1 Tax=Colletotrichum navitas TaxID=681940 RepID=A0AAD8PVF8_9PEZI|nr:uncharacterized protein LY79DRAFT_560639 [Colletotrichum navitas]KAK1580678.1 hypothetical protein LY79DRAFT_560639 [Colletotrichum navitas]
MLLSTLLTSLVAAGSARAAVMQGSWSVRADFSRCDGRFPLEVVLDKHSDGALAESMPTPNITDFRIPVPFEGTLVVKPAGAAGLGSPYPPQQVTVEILDHATGDPAIWANATVNAGFGQRGLIEQIGWSTGGRVRVGRDEERDVSIATTVNGGTLLVYYCGAPNATATALR